MSAVADSRVLFCYVPPGATKPSPADPNTVYFLEEAHELHVGDKVIVSSTPGGIPSIEIDGDPNGNFISNAVFNAEENKLTITKASADTIATENSTNLITSGAVYAAAAAATPTWTVIE